MVTKDQLTPPTPIASHKDDSMVQLTREAHDPITDILMDSLIDICQNEARATQYRASS